MSVNSIIDPATNKIYDDLIGQGGGINLNKGQIITATAIQEVAFPTVAPANGSVLSYDATTDTGLRYIANNPTALALNYQELFSATAGNNITPVPASLHDNYVLTSDTSPANPTGLVWKAVGGSGVIQTNAPLDDAEVANVSTISINFGAVAGEIPYGTGVLKTGALTNTPASATQFLGVSAGVPAWKDLGASGIITATAPIFEEAGVGNASNLYINFSAVAGEIPYGNGTLKTGALTNTPTSNTQFLGVNAGVPAWKDLGASGTITATAPLVESAGVGNASNIAINFTAVKGEIPAGNGTAGTGALIPAPTINGYVLTADSGQTTGLAWKQGGAPSAQTNFYPLTYPPSPSTPFITSGFSVILPAPATVGTFTQNEQITIMNYEPVQNPSANTFKNGNPNFEGITSFYTGNNTGGLEDYAYFTTGATTTSPYECILYRSSLPLSASSVPEKIGVFSVTGTPNALCRVNGIIRTASSLYFYGNFQEIVTTNTPIPAQNITQLGGCVKYDLTGLGSFSKMGGALQGGVTSALVTAMPAEIFCATLCPTTDATFGNYATNPKTMVLGGTFTEIGNGSIASQYICFYDEGTNAFTIFGDTVALDGILSPVQVIAGGATGFALKYGICSLLYGFQNELCISFNDENFILTSSGGTLTSSCYNCIGALVYKGNAGNCLAFPYGTSGQIQNGQNLYFANGLVRKISTGDLWLCIGFTDDPDPQSPQNCWWKNLTTGGNTDPLTLPASPLPPLQTTGSTCDIPAKLLYTFNATDDGPAYVAYMNFQINALPNGTSTLIWDDNQGTVADTNAISRSSPNAQGGEIYIYSQKVGQASSWTTVSQQAYNFLGINQALLPAYVVVYNLLRDPQGVFGQTDLDDQSVGVLVIGGLGVQYLLPNQAPLFAKSLIFKNIYTSIQLVVDLNANIYRTLNYYGDVEFSAIT